MKVVIVGGGAGGISTASNIRKLNKEIEKIVLKQLISELSPREQKLIAMRYFKGATQSTVAERLGISQVQVSRMEKKILENMRKNIQM